MFTMMMGRTSRAGQIVYDRLIASAAVEVDSEAATSYSPRPSSFCATTAHLTVFHRRGNFSKRAIYGLKRSPTGFDATAARHGTAESPSPSKLDTY